jgi:hypothetical protein
MSISEKWRVIAGLPKAKIVETVQVDEALKMAKVHVSQITSKDMPGLKDDVFGIRNESPVVDELIELLGIPPDGVPIRIRTGFMSYNAEHKMLFFSKNKYDLPGLIGKRPEGK